MLDSQRQEARDKRQGMSELNESGSIAGSRLAARWHILKYGRQCGKAATYQNVNH